MNVETANYSESHDDYEFVCDRLPIRIEKGTLEYGAFIPEMFQTAFLGLYVCVCVLLLLDL